MADNIGREIVTPAFVFDTAALTERVKYIKKTLGNRYELVYAIKANPFLVSALDGVVDAFEVCSPGEYRICERVGVLPERIVLSGVFKEKSDIERIVTACGARTLYTVESPSQAALLGRLGARQGVKLPVILRLSSGNQFGMDRPTLKRVAAEASGLDVIGIQLYSGTQKKPSRIEGEARGLAELAKELEKECGVDCRRIEYGPGLGVSYFKNEPPRDDDEALGAVVSAFCDVPKRVTVAFEMGRFIAAHCGEYYTQIVDKKSTDGVNYVIVDGGINHLNYYGQVMAMKLPFMRVRRGDGLIEEVCTPQGGAAEGARFTVCGALCTTADVLVKDCPLGSAELGDTLVFERTGAYTVTEGLYLFLSRDMPRVYVRDKDGALSLVRDGLRTDTFNGK